MIETTVLDYLNTAGILPSGVKAYMEQPQNAPARYVLIEKTSGSKENHMKKATIALQSYAESLYQAAALNEAVKEAMDESVALENIFRAKLNTDYNFTNTAKKQYRYQAVYDLAYFD